MARLGDYIREECNPLGASGTQELRLIGVSNEHGLHASSRETSADLARYQRIEKNWFAYNPMRVNVGSIGLADDGTKSGFTSPDYTVFSCRKGLDPHYLLHFLKSDYGLEAIARNCSGAVRKRLYYSGLAAIELPVPRMEEQRAFVARIDSISQTIRFIREENSDRHELPQLKQAILQSAIQGKLTSDWRAAHPDVESASQLLLRIQAEKDRLVIAKKLRPEKPLPKISPPEIPFEIPKNWEWCRLGNLFHSLQYGTALKCSYDSLKNTAILRIPNVSTGKLSTDDLKFTNLTKSEKEQYSLKKHDILMIRSNGSRSLVGSAVHFDEEAGNYGYAGYLMRLRFPAEIWSPFIVAALASRTVREQIEGPLRATVGINNVNTTEISRLKIPLPPLGEQRAIVERVEALMTTCRALEAEIEQARTHAAHLLQVVLKEAFAPAAC